MIDFKKLDLEHNVDYKLKCGQTITLKHVKVKDWNKIEPCLNILDIYKNEINDPQIVMMSYLEYLKMLCEQDKEIEKMFMTLLVYTIEDTIDKGASWDLNKGKVVYDIVNDKNEILWYLTAKDFDEIRKLILYMNKPNYDDTYIIPEIRHALEIQRKLQQRGHSTPTLEKQKIYVMSKTGFTIESLENMTYRTFYQLYNYNVSSDIYMANTILKGSYQYSIKDPVVHPMYQGEGSILDGILEDADSIKDKVGKING